MISTADTCDDKPGHHRYVCSGCNHCTVCDDCICDRSLFDADELGLDPESDNTPGHPSRVSGDA